MSYTRGGAGTGDTHTHPTQRGGTLRDEPQKNIFFYILSHSDRGAFWDPRSGRADTRSHRGGEHPLFLYVRTTHRHCSKKRTGYSQSRERAPKTAGTPAGSVIIYPPRERQKTPFKCL